jgi:hypothetical protein
MSDDRDKKATTETEILAAALGFVMGKLTALDAAEVSALDVTKVGDLRLPSAGSDAKQCVQIQTIVKAYAEQKNASRPLSFAVFGPPGSGKSTLVKELMKSSGFAEPPVINLSQVSDTKELLGRVMSGLAGQTGATPALFFDEFDTPFNETPLGWLRWFLSPMQDGVLPDLGGPVKIKRAVFVFAGGTAESLAEFDRRAQLDPESYRARKVPDFLSRLRASLDLGGLNDFDQERYVRRALTLRYQLKKRWPPDKDDKEPTGVAKEWECPIIKEDDVRALLSDGHFVHGARSMEALLEMFPSPGRIEDLATKLPDKAIVEQHFGRGKLDRRLVGISADRDKVRSSEVLTRLTRDLLRHGATLVYGGDFVPDGTLDGVVEAAKQAPQKLVDRHVKDKRIRNYLGYPTFLRDEVRAKREKEKENVDFFELQTIEPEEIEALNLTPNQPFRAFPGDGGGYDPRHHAAWALSLFRMRLRLLQDVSALVVLGGKDGGEIWGRFAGIAEEVMIAIALDRPVYVIGGCDGAARAVGRLLGLDTTIANRGNALKPCIGQDDLMAVLRPYAHCFEIPGVTNSPLELPDLRSFLYHRSVTTEAWPPNGLTVEENRELFAAPIATDSEAANRVVTLIVQGLSRLDWKAPARQPN